MTMTNDHPKHQDYHPQGGGKKYKPNYGCGRCNGDERSRRHLVNGVTFTNHKGSLAVVIGDNSDSFFDGEGFLDDDLLNGLASSSDNDRDIALARLYRMFAASLAGPPEFVSYETYGSGDLLESSQVELSEWVDRVERAAQLTLAADALDRRRR